MSIDWANPSFGKVETKTEPIVEIKELTKEEKMHIIGTEMHAIVVEYDGFSNIPVTHKYFELRKKLDALMQKP